MERKRIPELDLLRGAAVLGMIIIHFFYDLQTFGNLDFRLPVWLDLLGRYGHLIFILISGICATLGHNTFVRGIRVFACGLLVSYVTVFMEVILGYEHMGIWFGILHLLGFSMILYPLFRDFYFWELFLLSTFLIFAGIVFNNIPIEKNWLFPLGLCSDKQYPGSDFFPVLPYFGWFLMGAAAGKRFYGKRKSYLGEISRENFLLNFLQIIGKNSLIIYLFHQPVLLGIILLIT